PSKLSAFPARGKTFSHWITGSVKNQTLISQGTSWKYWDQATTPTGDWKASVFDDSGWETGNAQLGYGDGDEATEISFGGDPGNKIPSALFRKKFIIQNKHFLSDFEIHLLRDDGAMVYLNGQEIIRSNMPNGAIQRDTYALESIFDDGENTFHTFKVDSSLFMEGENTLAISIHQISAESSDLSFDLYLTAIEEGDSISTLFSQNLDLPLNEESRISPVFIDAKPVISEILYYPETNQHPAFIEICNPATSVYDLSHYQLEGLNFIFPSGVQLLPDECLILTENASMYQNQGYQVFQADSGALEVQGQEILLKDNTGKTIDSVAYQNQAPWPEVIVSGNSIELTQLQLDNNEGYNWAFNARKGGSPGIFTPISSIKGIRINEVMSTNESNIIDSEGEYEDWIEIYNHNDFPVNLGGMYLTDRKDNLLKWMIPVGHQTATTVPPKGHFIIYADGNPESGPNHLGFSLSRQGEFLAITDPQSLIIDSLTLPPLTENQSFGRTSDGAVSMTTFEAWSTTPKSANSAENTPPLFISEPVTEIFPGNNYHYEIEILDTSPEKVRITAECLPRWLQLIDYQNGKGNISGNITRNHIGQYRIILKAEDNYLNSSSLQEYILTIKDPVDEIAISSENGVVYPNPSDGFMHYIYPTPAGSEVLLEFFDLSGKALVSKTHLSAGDFFKIPIDISSFAPGVYFMKVRVNKQVISTHKIIKL
ncbi:MAG: lamin tail domain-containing protein, partial [Bacteroidetes bacterium]|nr:lamin tail domain-containing protein [Bacteroidota bacterium]